MEHESDLHCAVPGAALLSILHGCSEAVKLEQRGAELVIKDGGTTVKLSALAPDAFAFDPDSVEGGEVVCELSDAFIAALEIAVATSNQESIRPNLTGVTFSFSKGAATLYSTNNVTLTVVQIALKAKAIEGILPKDTCQLLIKTWKDLGGEAAGVVTVNKNMLIVELGSVRIAAKLIAEELASYAKMLSDNLRDAVFIECPSGLFDAATRALALIASAPNEPMHLSYLAGGFIEARAKGAIGELHAKIKAKGVPEFDAYALDPEALLIASAWAAELGLGAKALVLKGTVKDSIAVEYLISRKGQ